MGEVREIVPGVLAKGKGRQRQGSGRRAPEKHLRVRDLPVEERPRERLYREGARALTDRELVAILLRTGNLRENALALADRVLAACEGIGGLGEAVFEDLARLPGIGPAKAAQVLAAVELGRRSLAARRGKGIGCKVHTVGDIAAYLLPEMMDLDREHFRLVLLDVRGRIFAIRTISIGSLNVTTVHPRELFKEPLRRGAYAVVLVHNHPSGDCHPSENDIEITKRICEAGQILGIEVWDHLILGRDSFYSMRENGYFQQTRVS